MLYLTSLFFPKFALAAHGTRWVFQPFGWQLVFAMGMLATLTDIGRLTRSSPIVWLTVSITGLILLTGVTYRIHEWVGSSISEEVLLGKQNPGLLRVVHFVLVATLISATAHWVPANCWWTSTASTMLCMIGRNALAVFLWGVLVRYVSVIFFRQTTVFEIVMLDLFGVFSSVLLAILLDKNCHSSEKRCPVTPG